MTDFVPADQIIALVQEDLSSFDANNQLDPGRWYPMIQKVVSDLGISCYEYKHALLWVKDYKSMDFPCDFYILDSAFLVKDDCDFTQKGIVQYQGRSIIWDDTTTACATTEDCIDPCCEFRTCELSKFNEITVREYVRGLPYTYNFPMMYPLYVNQRVSKGWCLSQSICFGSKSKHEITINSQGNRKQLFTNFEDGLVLINYYAYPYDDNGLPKIPDSPKVQLAVEHYIKWKALENLWLNGDAPAVQQRMMYFKNEFENNSYPDAEYVAKLTSMNAAMDMVRNARNRLNVYQLIQK